MENRKKITQPSAIHLSQSRTDEVHRASMGSTAPTLDLGGVVRRRGEHEARGLYTIRASFKRRILYNRSGLARR